MASPSSSQFDVRLDVLGEGGKEESTALLQADNQQNIESSESEAGDTEAPMTLKIQATSPESNPPTLKEEAVRSLLECRELDLFLVRAYNYYTKKGFIPILLSEITNLLTLAFIVWFSSFLIYCVDHPLIKQKKKLADVIVPKCITTIPILPLAFLIVFSGWWILRAVKLFADYPLLKEMKLFFNVALEITDSELNSLPWSTVVNSLVKLKNEIDTSKNPKISKFDAHNIANRILRKENYMISMFNKDILNLKIPVFGKRHMLTRIMEWSLWFCIVDFVFDEYGTVKKSFLRESNRSQLAFDLRRRFVLFGALNLICSPFLLAIFITYFFFRYAEEYHKNPKNLGARQYSRFARWTFREFNELPHLFDERLNRTYGSATKYMQQFKNESVVILARFVTFISGSFAAILAIISLIDQALLVDFEITPGGSMLFYIGVFGGIFAAGNSLVPEGHEILDPESLVKEVISDLHYFPDEWRDKLHTENVRDQFGLLFEFNIFLLFAELMSLAFGPLIFWFSLPDSSEAIVDFFREFTVHVDSLGYVCSFAVFDFARNGNVKYGARPRIQNDHFVSHQGKMEQSFLDFKLNNPEWEPDVEGSMYLSTVLSRRNGHAAEPKSRAMLGRGAPPNRPLGGYRNESSGRAPEAAALVAPVSPTAMEDASGVSEGAEFFGLLNEIYERNRQQQAS